MVPGAPSGYRQLSGPVGLLTAIALAFAISGYVNWLSDAAWNEFMKTASAFESSNSRSAGPNGLPDREAKAANPNYTIAEINISRRGGDFGMKVQLFFSRDALLVDQSR